MTVQWGAAQDMRVQVGEGAEYGSMALYGRRRRVQKRMACQV